MGFLDRFKKKKEELGNKLERHQAENQYKEFQATQERIKKLKQEAIKQEARVLRQQRQAKARSQEAKLKKQIHEAKEIQHQARAEKYKELKQGLSKLLNEKPKPRRKTAKRKTTKRRTTRRKPAKRRKKRSSSYFDF